MPTTFACDCGQTLSVLENAGFLRTVCPGCGELVHVPFQASADEAPGGPPVARVASLGLAATGTLALLLYLGGVFTAG